MTKYPPLNLSPYGFDGGYITKNDTHTPLKSSKKIIIMTKNENKWSNGFIFLGFLDQKSWNLIFRNPDILIGVSGKNCKKQLNFIWFSQKVKSILEFDPESYSPLKSPTLLSEHFMFSGGYIHVLNAIYTCIYIFFYLESTVFGSHALLVYLVI